MKRFGNIICTAESAYRLTSLLRATHTSLCLRIAMHTKKHYVSLRFAIVRRSMKRSGDLICTAGSARRLTSLLRANYTYVCIRLPYPGSEKTHQKSVVKNSIIKRGRFEAPPPRHMMYEQCRASIHENACAPATRDRARSGRWRGRCTKIGQTTKPFRSSCMYVAGCSSFANALSKYGVAASRALRHTARIAHRFSMRRPLRLPIIFL